MYICVYIYIYIYAHTHIQICCASVWRRADASTGLAGDQQLRDQDLYTTTNNVYSV